MKSQNKSNDLVTTQNELALVTAVESLTKDITTLKRASKLSIEKASKGVSIVVLKNEDKGATISAIVLLLSELKMYVKIDVDDEWLFDWAETIAEDYYHFKFEDLILALKQGAKQKQYGSVLLSDVLQWCFEYEKKRMQYHEQRNNNLKEGYDSNRGSEMTIKKYLDK